MGMTGYFRYLVLIQNICQFSTNIYNIMIFNGILIKSMSCVLDKSGNDSIINHYSNINHLKFNDICMIYL